MNEEIAAKKSRINEEKKASEGIAEKLAALNQDQESNKSRLMDLIAREAQYKNIYQTTINNKESLQKRLAGVEEEENQARKQIKGVHKQEETARKQLETIKEDIQGLEEQIASAGSQ
ncbi:hypothetical protein GWN42_24010, partial [candidate division KSB1 bacterium]|nr:hypothetical protein [candidate division KSB1 bacterium]